MRLAPSPIARFLSRSARATWLGVLALVALHPLTSAANSGSAGLAELLRELLCGCASCAEVESPAPASCCETETETESERDCGSKGGCACEHPDEVPLAHVVPIAPASGGERAWLDALRLACAAPVAWQPVVADSARAVAVECRPPPVSLQSATHARRVPTTRVRLAWLATARI